MLDFTDSEYRERLRKIAGSYRRYHCPMSRTLSLGQPAPKVLDTANIVVEGLNAALEAARPGITCEEAEAAWRRVLQKYGLSKEFRIGYSTGVNYPPDWGSIHNRCRHS